MKLAFDTSALVSIETINLISKVLKYFEILISDTVKQELFEMAQYEDEHGRSAKRLHEMIEKNQIKIIDVKNFSQHLTAVDSGEASCLEIALSEEADYLVTDDFNSFWYLSERFKSTVFSIFLVKLLSDLGEITDEEGWGYVEKMREKRTWGNNVIYKKAKELWKRRV
ncbi:MAG: hypothetical protein Q8N79_08445 [Candidatus Methanoperedens sp.]|nr:hypothetical protein [Candidatus Methanoperedens sp.]